MNTYTLDSNINNSNNKSITLIKNTNTQEKVHLSKIKRIETGKSGDKVYLLRYKLNTNSNNKVKNEGNNSFKDGILKIFKNKKKRSKKFFFRLNKHSINNQPIRKPKEIIIHKEIFGIFNAENDLNYNPVPKIIREGQLNRNGNTNYFVLMEKIEGKTLNEYIMTHTNSNSSSNSENKNNVSKKNVNRMKRIIIDLLKFAKILSIKGYKHCDLNVNNIFVNIDNNKIGIIDFGLSVDENKKCKKRRKFSNNIYNLSKKKYKMNKTKFNKLKITNIAKGYVSFYNQKGNTDLQFIVSLIEILQKYIGISDANMKLIKNKANKNKTNYDDTYQIIIDVFKHDRH